jgi:hypothetical protein
MATGGFAKKRGTDTIPAMLTPGEFVVNRAATSKFGPLLQQMNRGTLPGLGRLPMPTSTRKQLPPPKPMAMPRTAPALPDLQNLSGLGQRNMERPKLPNFSASKYQGASKPVPHISKPSTKTVNNTTNPVSNYSLSVNANGSNLNANDIARSVMTQIKNIESQRIRRN